MFNFENSTLDLENELGCKKLPCLLLYRKNRESVSDCFQDISTQRGLIADFIKNEVQKPYDCNMDTQNQETMGDEKSENYGNSSLLVSLTHSNFEAKVMENAKSIYVVLFHQSGCSACQIYLP